MKKIINAITLITLPVLFFKLYLDDNHVKPLISIASYGLGELVADQALYYSWAFRGIKSPKRYIFGTLNYIFINVISYLFTLIGNHRSLEGCIQIFSNLEHHLTSPLFVEHMLEVVVFFVIMTAAWKYLNTELSYRLTFYCMYFGHAVAAFKTITSLKKAGEAFTLDDYKLIAEDSLFGDHRAPLVVLIGGLFTLNFEYEPAACNIPFHIVGTILGSFVYQFGAPLMLLPSVQSVWNFIGIKNISDLTLFFMFFWFVFYVNNLRESNLNISLRGPTARVGPLVDKLPKEVIEHLGKAQNPPKKKKKKNKNKKKRNN